MHMENMFIAVLQAITAIIVAWLGKHAADDKKAREKRQKEADEREARREQRDKFLLEYMDLSADLAEAQTVAIVNGKTNGEMHKAQEELSALRTKYRQWLISLATKEG